MARHINTNECIFTGNLPADAEVKVDGDSQSMRFRLGVNDYGEDKTSWLQFTDWNPGRVDRLAQYLTKGKQVLVRARAQSYQQEIGDKKLTFVSFKVESIELLGGGAPTSNGSGDAAAVPAGAGASGDDAPF